MIPVRPTAAHRFVLCSCQEFDKLQTRKMKGLKRNIKVDDKRFEDRDGEPSAKKEAKTNGHATAEDMDF